MSIFDTWTTVAVRGTGSRKTDTMFRVQCAGGYCAICEKCEHRSLVSPNIHHALLCPHCIEPLVLPLGAHFACPARIEAQFAIKHPFNIEKFLAFRTNEQAADSAQSSSESLRKSSAGTSEVSCLFVGFMDLARTKGAHRMEQCGCGQGLCSHLADYKCAATDKDGNGNYCLLEHTSPDGSKSRSGGFWSSLLTRCSIIGGRRTKAPPQLIFRHVLAVADSQHITWYEVDCRGWPSTREQYRRVEQIELAGTQFSAAPGGSGGTRLVASTRSGTKVEMELGSRLVAGMWLHALTRRGPAMVGRGGPMYNGGLHRWTVADGANVHAFNNIANGYSSSGFADDDSVSEYQFEAGSDDDLDVEQEWVESSRSQSGSLAAIRLTPI
ncbi:hypothetical protein GGI02_001375 [Coemansia sp. RSA 2322]|nr:hypothetical protein GGI02_001375 [Coemansia sp. RSA 2322]